jgi:ubiquinone/menaquinone biosynthesis C-methylase UbiE
VKHAFDKYFETDIRQENLPKRESNSIIQLRVDAGNLSGFDDYSFDRLIASCVIFHLSDPETALREWRRVLKVGGRLDFYVPSEPGALLRLLRSLTTVRKAKRMGLDHYAFHYREHRFSYPFIHTLIKDVFQADSLRISSFPVPWTSWNASLWKVVRVTKLAKLEESKRKG